MKNYKSAIDIASYLHTLDWLIILVTFLLTMSLIIYGNRKKSNSPSEYMLMGRQLTLPLFVATLVASWYGGIIGVTQIAFEQGIYNLFTQGIFWYISYIIFAVFLVKKIRSYGVTSLPELVANIYGPKSAWLTAFFLFCKTLPITYAISIGLLLQLIFPINLITGTAIGVLAVTVYSSLGGLRAVVYSNLAQFILMCAGLSCVFLFSVNEFGGINFLKQNLPAEHFTVCGSNKISTTLVWLFIACSTTFINPSFYQRCFAAKSNRTAKTGIFIATVIWILLDICTPFGAMYARAVIPEADSLTAYIVYSIQLLPVGFRGLLIASIIATIVSTLDSLLFIASNIIHQESKPYISTIATAAITIILASFFNGNIEKIWLIYKSYFCACLLLPIMFGYFMPSLANDKLFYTSGVLSCLCMTLWEIYCSHYLDSFYIGCIVSSATFVIYFTLDTRNTILMERKRRII